MAKYMRFFIIGLCLLANSAFGNGNNYQWQIGEELSYKVKYSFIRLGTVRIVVHDTLTYDDAFVYHIKLFIDSNPLIFFVNMHNVYDSYIDDKFRLRLFSALEIMDGKKYDATYSFDYDKKMMHINMTSMKDTSKTIIDDVPLNEEVLDGASLIYYARAHVHSNVTDTLTSFFEAKKGKVLINFKGENEAVKIGAFDEPLNTYYLDGVVKMKGIAGLTGPYKGWFMRDRQRPPLKAEMKVFIGSVKIELEEWKNWSPHTKMK
ncbi:DUF3108 domain-containing protein [candidate division KSB1 bacterium]|nr:DUF3108 domain-containing protein [candidate division KSB1 bacterium]